MSLRDELSAALDAMPPADASGDVWSQWRRRVLSVVPETVHDGDLRFDPLGWFLVTRRAWEDVGNWPREARESVPQEMWIEDERGRRLPGMGEAVEVARKTVEGR